MIGYVAMQPSTAIQEFIEHYGYEPPIAYHIVRNGKSCVYIPLNADDDEPCN